MAESITIPEGFEIEYNPNEIPEGFEIENPNTQALENVKELSQDDNYVKTQKYQEEQLAKLLFTPEELEEIDSKGPMGWMEYRGRNFFTTTDAIPFVGLGARAVEANKVISISDKLDKGEEVSPQDKEFMTDYLRKQIEANRRGLSWSSKIASMPIQAVAFMGEFALSGGIGGTAAKASAIGAIKMAGSAATKTAIKLGSKIATNKTAAQILGVQATEKIGTKAALNVAGEIAGRTATQQAILIPTYAIENYGERRIAQGLKITDKGEAIFETPQGNELKTAAQALGTAEITVLSELSGGLLNVAGKGVMSFAKGLGSKVATTNVARGISSVSASIYNSLPKNVRVKLEACARVSDNLKNKATQVGENIKDKNIAFHGVVEEMGEERVNDILLTAFDLDSKQGYSGDQFLEAIFPSPQDLLLEAGVFSIMGGASLATRTVINDYIQRGLTRQEATTLVNSLTEIEKENMANEIIGEVAINEDITEEEIQAEIENIEKKLNFSDFISNKYLKENKKPIVNFYEIHKDFTEQEPEKYKGKATFKDVLTYLGSIDNKSATIKTPIDEVIFNRNNLHHLIIDHPERLPELSKIIKTIQSPNLIVSGSRNGKNYKYYIKNFKKDNKNKSQFEVIKVAPDGNFYSTSYTLSNSKFKQIINGGQIEYDLTYDSTAIQKTVSVDNTIPQNDNDLNSNEPETLQDLLEDKPVQANKELSEKEKNKIESSLQGYNWFNEFYRNWVDSLTPLEQIEKLATEKTDIPLTKQPYFMARMYAGTVESIKSQIENKTFTINKDGSINFTGEGFFPIIKDFNELIKEIEPSFQNRMNDFTDFLVARRYLLDLKDREGFEATEEQKEKAIQDIARLDIKYGDTIEDFTKIADRLYKFNQRILHNLVDSGNMSQEVYDKIVENNPHHISYKRIMDENYGKAISKKPIFTGAKSPIKAIKGSEREIQNIFVSTLEDVSRILDVAARNRVATNIANLKDILPEYIQKVNPKMEMTTAKVKVAYDVKLRQKLEEAIKKFGGKLEYKKSLGRGKGLILGDYNPNEMKIRKRLGSQDRTLAHEFGHMLDFALDVQSKITPAIKKELLDLAEDRLTRVVTLSNDVFIETDEGKDTKSYIEYVKNDREIVANMFDLYFTSRDYLKKVAPKSYKMIETLFKDYEFLKDIRPSSQTGIEEIEQDVWRPSTQDPKGNIIKYYVDGKRQYVEVPKVVYDAVQSMREPELNLFEQIGRLSANVLRTGATSTPEFAIRNFLRDQQAAFMYYEGNNPLRPVLNIPKGLMAVLEKKIKGSNKLYDEWVASGGAFSSYMELNEQSIENAIKDYTGEFNKAQKIINATLKPFKEFSSVFEEATRLSMYATEKLDGATALKAAFVAREGTLDFGRSGVQGKKVNKYIPFFNAGIQGTDRLIRAFKKHPYLMSAKAFATMTIPQIALTGYYLFAAPDDDREEYLNIPDYQKAFFYCFKVGDTWVRLPKEFTLGYVFASIPEKFMTWMYQNKKPEAKELFKIVSEVLGSAVPVSGPTDVLPPILRIAIENIANWDFFRNKHIYPEHLNDLAPSERYNKYTSETAKLLGEKLNMSPAKIEHAINAQLGTSGRYATDLGDLIINEVRKLQGEEVNENVSTMADKPFVRGFVLRDPIGYQALSTNQFFDNYKKVNEINKTYKKYLKDGDREKAIAYREKHENEFMAYNRYNSTYKRIKETSKTMDKIYSDVNLTSEEKKERLLPLQKRISDLSFDINQWYEELKRSK